MSTRTLHTPSLGRLIGIAMASLLVFGGLAGTAVAHSDGHGEMTLHDSEDGPPTDSLECEFWVKFRNMTHSNGTLHATQREGHSHAHAHDLGNGTWEGTKNETTGGWDFFGGPFTTHASDSYKIEVWTTLEENEGDEPSHYQGMIVEYRACDQPPREDPFPPECVDDIEAQAMDDGSIKLSWEEAERADNYTIMRGTGEGYFEIATVENTSYTDTDTEAETTYEYRIDAANEGGDTLGCQYVEATAIPFFESPALVALAAVGSVGAVAVARRVR